MRWNSEERAFAFKAYFSSGCSVIETQHAFWNRFHLAQLAPIPDRKSIVTWVITFRQTASATKRRTGVPRSVRSPENIEAVKASILRSPRRYARKPASALGLSDRSVRRILHDDLQFHPYKMAIVEKLSERDFNSRMNACELLIDVSPEGAIVFFFYSDEAHFLWGFLKSRVYVIRPRTLKDLKIANITSAMPIRVTTNDRNRFTQCMENGGRHL